MDAIGLYIHTPFCTTKCGYCDFYSVPLAGRAVASLVEALLAELEYRVEAHADKLSTIFVGGGTPTVLPGEELRRLLGAVTAIAGRGRVEEFTVEANPATLDPAKAGLLAEAGVTRVSFGAQSFHSRELAVLERLHGPDDVPRSVEQARRAGLQQIYLDLIFGIPSQTLASWDESLRRALDLAPEHLALYGLTYEPGTALAALRERGRLTPCDEGLERDMYLHAIDRLTAAGFEHYEISNFARPGRRCRHNLACWHNRPYVGIGPSAAGFMNGRRTRNIPDVERYVMMVREQGHAEIESERLDPLAFAGETAMLWLRLIEGIERDAFRRTTGFDPFELFAEPLARHAAAGLLVVDGSRIRLTRDGLCVADSIIVDFIDPERSAVIQNIGEEDRNEQPRGHTDASAGSARGRSPRLRHG